MSVINTNITALVGQQNLGKAQNSLQTSMERLSSGMRINSAKDDAAGQAIANRMTAQVNGLNQAQRNANDGISLAQTAEGALNQINDNLQRVRELTVQAQNATNSDADIESIQAEVDERLAEIDRVAEQTTFNGLNLFGTVAGDGSFTGGERTFDIQVGANDDESITITVAAADTASIADGDVNGFKVADFTHSVDGPVTGTEDPLEKLDAAIASIDESRSNLGAIQNRFESAIENLQTTEINLSAARSRIEDADYAVEVSNMTRANILQQAGTSVLAQANQTPQSVLSLLG